MIRYRIPIPSIYVGLTKGSTNRGRLFRKYVQGYLKRTYPDMKLIKTEGMCAVCERRG
ncbi:hypothetical protein SAMN05192534_12419 [Alteribacillus persepolensis]|uniref:Transposase n=1 Tax=Alteribacillus persepolensis TaxID=568899 RepID=A0A1G8IHH4_9BACI|nr:hypothetical protein SAMN05192534_12419 [Alteribacillus persepolensis]